MQNDQASDIDMKLMDKVVEKAHTNLATGGAGVAALLAPPDEIIAVAHNTILETGLDTSCSNTRSGAPKEP